MSGEVYEPLRNTSRTGAAAAAVKDQNKIFQEEKKEAQSPVPVTALIAWLTFLSAVKRQMANQIAAPAETRMPNMHRAKRTAPRECGWQAWRQWHSAGEKPLPHEKKEFP